MPYVAHVAIKLKEDLLNCPKNEWHCKKNDNNIEFRWRLLPCKAFEVIAGIFHDKYEALKYAKQLYVAVIYRILCTPIQIQYVGCETYESRFCDENADNELFFLGCQKHYGSFWGLGVYEVNASIDEFDDYNFEYAELESVGVGIDFDFDNIDEYVFTYSKDSQHLLSAVLRADDFFDIGMQMTIYCGLLEFMATDNLKEEVVINEINELKKHVVDSNLSNKQQENLLNFLELGKNISAGQKCRTLIEKYAKPTYGEYAAKKIFKDAYSSRSSFSHGEKTDDRIPKTLWYMKYLVLDVIKGYILDKETNFNA